jgi:hypothetical protein
MPPGAGRTPASRCREAEVETLRIYFKLVGMALKSMTQFRS